MNYRELKAKLAELEAEIIVVRAEDEILTDARIDSSKPGGTTARGQPSTQFRLRVKGQKARYLKASEVAKTRAAIARGKRLKQLERERQRVQAQLERLAAKAAELGLDLPE
ncbi:hypothetical protein ACN4EK_13330 [Pantanalinema rosaneae CENA516]|uniref:hypothetical protein n=1 Tax=Pantanalinema rosaneae TaxID=1620701 RepID=UPI003D6F3B15